VKKLSKVFKNTIQSSLLALFLFSHYKISPNEGLYCKFSTNFLNLKIYILIIY